MIEVPFVNAAIWLISRKCIEKVGGFSPMFFHYCEDNNFVSRMIYHKLKIGIVTNSKGFHDREFRTENKFYANDYLVLERDLIMTLSNPNLDLSIFKIFLATIFSLIKNFFFRIDDNHKRRNYLKAIFNIDYQKIKKIKEISKTQKLAFLNLEKEVN